MELICIDTSVLIEFYRKTDKSKSFFYSLAASFNFAIPTVVQYEILRGDTQKDQFWLALFSQTQLLDFNPSCASKAAEIYMDLKKRNKLTGTDDILIAATALTNQLRLANLNKKHFENVPNLQIIAP